MSESPRKKVAIVVGDSVDTRLTKVFECLQNHYEVTLYVLSSAIGLHLLKTGFKVRLFETIESMPGYMRGLEDEVVESDLIISLESSRLSSFQAVRAARRLSVPICILASEFQPYFYDGYPNIRAIQSDIIHKAEHFWVTSAKAKEVLLLDGAREEFISVIPPKLDLDRFKFTEKGRQKFRGYIGIGPDDVTLLWWDSLDKSTRLDELFRALKMLSKTNQVSVKLLVAGNGSQAMDLKYLAHDLGIGHQILFLHQNPEPFLVDLLSASDVILSARRVAGEIPEPFPFTVLEAAAVGVIPLVGASSLQDELLGGLAPVYSDWSAPILAQRLLSLIPQDAARAMLKAKLRAYLEERNSVLVSGEMIVSIIEANLAKSGKGARKDVKFSEFVQQLKEGIHRRMFADAQVQIEEALLQRSLSDQEVSQLHGLKGTIELRKGDLEAATNSFECAMKLNDTNIVALKGLAAVARQTMSSEEALVYYRRALAIDAQDKDCHLGVGLVFRALGLNEEAIFWLEKCLVGFGMNEASVPLAQAVTHMANKRAAARVLERVIEVVGDDNHTLLMALGQIYLGIGRAIEGHAILERALAQVTASKVS